MADENKGAGSTEPEAPKTKTLAEMTATELQAEHDRMTSDEDLQALAAKPQNELTGDELARKREVSARLKEIQGEFNSRLDDVELDLDSKLEIPEPTPASDPAPAATAADAPDPAPGDGDPAPGDGGATDTEKELLIAQLSQKSHRGSGNTGTDTLPTTAQTAARQPLMIAGLERAADVEGDSGAVLRAGMEARIEGVSVGDRDDDWRVMVARLYSTGTKNKDNSFADFPVWESRRWSDETPVMTNQASALYGAEAMGLVGNINRADACNPRFINEPEYCVAPESEAQAWIPKFAMDGECEVKTKDPENSVAPTFFEWAYSETLGDPAAEKTGLVVGGDVPAPYDSADEATWKPVSALTTTCTENTWRLRSVGYIREIGRGQDLCDPAAVARAMAHDTAYLEQNKSQSVINAFDAYATAKSTVHTWAGASATEFNNPFSSLSYMFGEARPAYEHQYGVDFGDATLFLPSNIAAVMGVARYETINDNTRYTGDAIAEMAGAGDIVYTKQIAMTGGHPIGTTVPAAILYAGRERVIPMYLSWRGGWRQGQGPGVRGSVTSDERNLRGNKRLVMVEDDLVNIHLGCLSTVKFTPTLNIQGGHTAGSAPVVDV